jgi:NAD(P)-dependent dehydrogenase (short-subunit alcohol dehydrogenase family)
MGLRGLEGRRALVTGAGRGIGAGIARRLVEEGVAVAVNDVDPATASATAQALSEGGAGAIPLPGDVGDTDAAPELIAAAVEALGGLDILVNNAGIGVRKSIVEHTHADWRRVLGVNLDAPFRLAQAAIPQLERSEGGAIVNIASVAIIGFFGQIAYDASKGGLLSMTRSLACELGRKRIRANVVCPGFIDTDLAHADADLAAIGEKLIKTLPVARWGKPADIAAAVAWLASDDAAYVTGQHIMVDGGWVRGA